MAFKRVLGEEVPRHNGEVLEGLAKALRSRDVDPKNVILVCQREYAFGSPYAAGSRYLVTDGLGPCIAFLAHKPDERIGFMAHIDWPQHAIAAVQMAEYMMPGRKGVFLFGGNGSENSRSIASELRARLGLLDGVAIIGQDLLRGSMARSVSIALDTKTGGVFTPNESTLNEAEKDRGAFDAALRLRNPDPRFIDVSRVPIEEFRRR